VKVRVHMAHMFSSECHDMILQYCTEAVDMNGRFQMQGGKNWFLPKEMNANRFFWDSHWLEIWSNHFYPSMGPNGGSVAMDSVYRVREGPSQTAILIKL
jgi:hypothetical protein